METVPHAIVAAMDAVILLQIVKLAVMATIETQSVKLALFALEIVQLVVQAQNAYLVAYPSCIILKSRRVLMLYLVGISMSQLC